MNIELPYNDPYHYIENGTYVWLHVGDSYGYGTVTERFGVGDYCWYYITIDSPHREENNGWYHYYDTVIVPEDAIKFSTPCMSCGFFRYLPAPGGCKDTRSHAPLNTPEAKDKMDRLR